MWGTTFGFGSFACKQSCALGLLDSACHKLVLLAQLACSVENLLQRTWSFQQCASWTIHCY
jgi:hypothetical protein